MKERADWRAVFSAHGVRIGIRTSRRSLLRQLRAQLPPGSKQVRRGPADREYTLLASGSHGVHTLSVDSRPLIHAHAVRTLLGVFAADVELAVAEQSPQRVFIHAGVVGWRGRALILPGRSMCGKSTLVAALVRAGARYYSDEYALLDLRGRVYPYPRRLALRTRGNPGRRWYTPKALGGRAGQRPLPIGLVVLSHYQPGARWRPRRLPPGRAALALMAHTVPARWDPRRAMTAVQQAVLRAPVLRGARGEARDICRAFLERLAQSPD